MVRVKLQRKAKDKLIKNKGFIRKRILIPCLRHEGTCEHCVICLKDVGLHMKFYIKVRFKVFFSFLFLIVITFNCVDGCWILEYDFIHF